MTQSTNLIRTRRQNGFIWFFFFFHVIANENHPRENCEIPIGRWGKLSIVVELPLPQRTILVKHHYFESSLVVEAISLSGYQKKEESNNKTNQFLKQSVGLWPAIGVFVVMCCHQFLWSEKPFASFVLHFVNTDLYANFPMGGREFRKISEIRFASFPFSHQQ